MIVGGGFAGASTAWWLRKFGETDSLILEREVGPGMQASGQNAAMARQATQDLFITRLLAEGVRFLATPPPEFRAPRPVLRRLGSALLGSDAQVGKLADVLRRAIPSDEFEIGPAANLATHPYLSGIPAPMALYTRSDGMVDLDALLSGFLRNTDVATSCAFLSAARDPDGWTVQTSRGDIRCYTLVIAAGAWGNLCGSGAGAGLRLLRPTTRHLFQSVRGKDFCRDAPFVWDTAAEVYVRPDGGGSLYMSACDQDDCDPSAPILPSNRIQEILRGKLARAFPALAAIRYHRYWVGTRTLSPDNRFVIGPDPRTAGLFWAAGLGGHGVTASPAIGRIAAQSILGLQDPPPELSPARFEK
ncbi:MAG: hypothetical protein A3G34_04245 [Candidatus Lindowbacteria bacterium RIFCSPLOWO2_12_FULL_62_27]|nr:MAG: hypothetical protein A3G34_04245 [Candidatus Lindowbacteria bacterium RIFCSPLOWO2_12_FULL_62_27]OGH63516.1 MAG: hypothetical protein A3I06_13610 [Candidatus Lindowbacteria bacterium RIFCSPLOWO2_02_FULL_62_12]